MRRLNRCCGKLDDGWRNQETMEACSAIWTIENFEEKAETGEKCLPVRGPDAI